MSAISGSRISACLPCLQRGGDRFEIGFRLAGAGDAVEQRRREFVRVHRLDHVRGGLRLRERERRAGEGRIGLRPGAHRRQRDFFERARV